MKIKVKAKLELRVLTDVELKAVSGGLAGAWCAAPRGPVGSGILPPPVVTFGPAVTIAAY